MKITTKLVLDMGSMEVLEEESFEYDGAIAHCGGGGSSGEVSYPLYMMEQHHIFLNTIHNIIQTEIYRNPHNAGNVFNPSVILAGMENSADKLIGPIANLSTSSDYANIVELTKNEWNKTITDSGELDNLIDEFSIKFDEDIEANVIPKFEAGMRDINAVQSSGFVTGKALIYASRDNSVASFAADIRIKAHFDARQSGIKNIHDAYSIELQATGLKFEYIKALSHMQMEGDRLAIVAQKEFADGKVEERDAASRFQLELMTYGGNMLASIGSASVQTGARTNKAASAMGGALSGAAVGFTVGGPYGAVIGGVIGGAAGLLA